MIASKVIEAVRKRRTKRDSAVLGIFAEGAVFRCARPDVK
jgi:hypothetical protein